MIECEAVVFAQQNTNLADMDVLSISQFFSNAWLTYQGKLQILLMIQKALLCTCYQDLLIEGKSVRTVFDYWMNRTSSIFIAEDQRPEMVLAGYDSVNFALCRWRYGRALPLITTKAESGMKHMN